MMKARGVGLGWVEVGKGGVEETYNSVTNKNNNKNYS